MINQRDMDLIQLKAQEIFAQWMEEFWAAFYSRESKNGNKGNG